MRAHFLVVLAACLLAVFPASAATSDTEISSTISEFLKEPLSPAATGLAQKILTFAEESPNHEIAISPKYTPWLEEEKASAAGSLLLAAFFAGNLKAQIESGVSSPKPYEGVLAVIDVYKKIQARKAGFRMASVDRLIDLERQGTLKSYIEKE